MVEAIYNNFAENSYILYNEKDAYIVDPGSNYERTVQIIEDYGLTIKGVLLTHGHFDHINGLNKLLDTYEVPLYIHEYDRDFLFDPGLNLSIQMAGSIARFKLKEKHAVRLVKEGDTLTLGNDTIRFTHSPGHTRGGVLIHYKYVVFTGDTLFRESVGRTDLPTGNKDQLADSIKRIMREVDANTLIYPGHGPRTTLAHEMTHNPFLKTA